MKDVLKANQRYSYCMQQGHKLPTGRLCLLSLITGGQQLARMPRTLLNKQSSFRRMIEALGSQEPRSWASCAFCCKSSSRVQQCTYRTCQQGAAVIAKQSAGGPWVLTYRVIEKWWRQKLGTVILDGYVMLNASFSFCFAKPSAQHPVSPKSVCCAGTGVCLASLLFCAGSPTTTLECVLVGGGKEDDLDRHTTLPKARSMMWTLRTRSGSSSGVHSAHLPTSLTREDRGHLCHSCDWGFHALLIHLPLIAPAP